MRRGQATLGSRPAKTVADVLDVNIRAPVLVAKAEQFPVLTILSWGNRHSSDPANSPMADVSPIEALTI